MATSEMIISSELLNRNRRSTKLAQFSGEERVRSAQLYGVKPDSVREAVRQLVHEHGVHHVDLNFGCPVRKITSKGGGSALPLRPALFARLVAAAVEGAGGEVPVTVKFRIGLTPDLTTHINAGRIAEAEGAAALTLHARTADQMYSPPAHWEAIAQLVRAVSVPVVGNGDVFEGRDAVRMMAETGCAGVMVGRACLGRPWVFREVSSALLQAAAAAPAPASAQPHLPGSTTPPQHPGHGFGTGTGTGTGAHGPGGTACAAPARCDRGAGLDAACSPLGDGLGGGPVLLGDGLGEGPVLLGGVARLALRQAEREVEWYRDYDECERDSVLRLRKFVSLYLHGFSSAAPLRARLMAATSLADWRAAVYDDGLYDTAEPFLTTAARFPRLKGAGPPVRQRMGLPDGWLQPEGEGEGGRRGREAEARLTDDVCEG